MAGPDAPTSTVNVDTAEADSPRPSTRAARVRRGTQGAAATLGALALASGVTAAIDAIGSSTQFNAGINAGRLAITLTAHGGLKLDTCSNSNSGYTENSGDSNSSTTSNNTQDFGNSATNSDNTQILTTSNNDQIFSDSTTTSGNVEIFSGGSGTFDNGQLDLPPGYDVPTEQTSSTPPGFSSSGVFWVEDREIKQIYGIDMYFGDNYDDQYSNDKLDISDYEPNGANDYDPNSEMGKHHSNDNIDDNDIDPQEWLRKLMTPNDDDYYPY
ncbi:hypothetical protein [Mycobacterium attenuatum]|uniref:hypothetical protein n=1 Tax=Mycobacterium attenuatum TaxID=2341086 RepID=UPI0010A96569|nr:hypothetical protein [Mycobacterium attenuatum]